MSSTISPAYVSGGHSPVNNEARTSPRDQASTSPRDQSLSFGGQQRLTNQVSVTPPQLSPRPSFDTTAPTWNVSSPSPMNPVESYSVTTPIIFLSDPHASGHCSDIPFQTSSKQVKNFYIDISPPSDNVFVSTVHRSPVPVNSDPPLDQNLLKPHSEMSTWNVPGVGSVSPDEGYATGLQRRVVGSVTLTPVYTSSESARFKSVRFTACFHGLRTGLSGPTLSYVSKLICPVFFFILFFTFSFVDLPCFVARCLSAYFSTPVAVYYSIYIYWVVETNSCKYLVISQSVNTLFELFYDFVFV